MTQRFFPQGRLTEEAFAAAETAARVEIEAIARQFGPSHWREAYASSGTAAALAEILEQNGFSGGGITPAGLARLRKRMIAARHIARAVAARAQDRAGAGARRRSRHHDGAVDELGDRAHRPGRRRAAARRSLRPARQDDRRRRARRDRRSDSSIATQSIARTRRGSQRSPSRSIGARCRTIRSGAQLIEWAARLHEIGMSVSHIGFHKHGAYILQHADMPGFSAGEQSHLALLVFGCRGGLAKMQPGLGDPTRRAQLLVLRLAVIFHHARAAIKLPRIQLRVARRIALGVSARWLAAHPLTAYLLAKERAQWGELGYRWKTLHD